MAARERNGAASLPQAGDIGIGEIHPIEGFVEGARFGGEIEADAVGIEVVREHLRRHQLELRMRTLDPVERQLRRREHSGPMTALNARQPASERSSRAVAPVRASTASGSSTRSFSKLTPTLAVIPSGQSHRNALRAPDSSTISPRKKPAHWLFSPSTESA